MGTSISYYKPGQGTLTRWVAFTLVELLVLFGCRALYGFVARYSDGWMTVLSTVPVVDLDITYGLLISLAVAAAFTLANYVFVVNRPKCAEFLIETEGELKKVNWPPRHEFLGSSFIVILSVVIISLYLLFIDTFLAATVQKLILR